jgi:hypothetical protein
MAGGVEKRVAVQGKRRMMINGDDDVGGGVGVRE